MTKSTTEPAGRKKQRPARLIDKRELLHRVPLSYTAIHGMMIKGLFPRSVALTEGDRSAKAAWVEAEVEAWIKDRPRKTLKGDDEPKPTTKRKAKRKRVRT